MLIYFRVQHIEVDCFGCSCSWFLAPVLASGVLGRVHLLPSSQAQCGETHQHSLPSENLVLCQVHGGSWVPGEVAGSVVNSQGVGAQGGGWHKMDLENKADTQSINFKKEQFKYLILRGRSGG